MRFQSLLSVCSTLLFPSQKCSFQSLFFVIVYFVTDVCNNRNDSHEWPTHNALSVYAIAGQNIEK